MKTSKLTLILLLTSLLLLTTCKKEEIVPNNNSTTTTTGGSSTSTKGITSQAEAKSVYGSIKGFLDTFDNSMTSSFATITVSGDKGKATISGKKTSSSSSTSTSSSTTSTLDMNVTFAEYSSHGVLVTGDVADYDYDYYRTACSSSTCASSNTVNEYIKGSNIKVEFTYDGKKVKETITINVTRTSSYGTLSGKLTTASGSSFSI